ncbi:M48 family metalloprotease [Ferriphaselus sp. R-1]|uniref:beta-barrel assembly-enhancing protease n=1 Tax=Ferriphaselus sp. R-1 TaxID=1485544 RepID=UPI0005535F33|nr:M48 family metalloprotease [Ferriphaselus sp. R-1]
MKKLATVLLSTLPLLAYADGLPDLGDTSQEAVSPQQERQIGRQSMFEIRADKSYLDDPEVNDYLNQLGYRLVANSNEPSQDFEFFAINNAAINAFALPGGFIGVHSGLILTAQTESELASVLAHEISHVTQHHLARMIAGQKYDTLASMAAVAVAILAARNNPQASQAALVGAQAGLMQRKLDFTRSYEKEADRIGIELLERSGFDTRAMPAFFERLQKANSLQEGNAPSYLRTHPLTLDRIADVDNRVQQLPYKLVADSLSFRLVRAKLQAMEQSPANAVAYFTSALGPQRFGDPVAQRYGLVLSLLRQRKTDQAELEFATLYQHAPQNPMLETLAGQMLSRKKSGKEVSAFYKKALQRFPQHRALVYDYADQLLREQNHAQVIKLLEERIIGTPTDPRLYELQAQAYTGMNQPQPAHRALAYAALLQGNLTGAIQQMELAKLSGNDFYQIAAIESELKELYEMAAARKKK